HLHELQRLHSFFRREIVRSMLLEELIHVFGRAVQDDIDVVIARRPRIAKDLASLALELRRYGIAKPIQCLTQRSAPFLVPLRMTAGIASAVAVPAFDTVG